jgi:uncharacterized protein (TIGR00730 family)
VNGRVFVLFLLYVKMKKKLKKEHFRVSIFGSSRAKRGSLVYRQVYLLAKMLAREDIDIVTGGGPGLMEAANRGHKAGQNNGKSHSIGLAIRLSKEQKINKSLDVVKEFDTFSKRLDNFMLLSNAVVVTPGGVGTLLEFFYTWQLVQVNKICDIPIIFLGNMWDGLFDWLKKNPMKKGYFDKQDLDRVFLEKNCSAVIKIIKKARKEYEDGTGDLCLNRKGYGL